MVRENFAGHEPSESEEVMGPVNSVNNSNNNIEEVENFGNMRIDTDKVLKAIFWGAVFYLLSLPNVYKMTAKVVGKKVDGVLVHAVVYAVVYLVVSQFI
tara:strand:+ start:501 stop:797 length:297 start_codon:yes stop_codon:yes gene_type:complete